MSEVCTCEWKLTDTELQAVYDGIVGDYIPCSTKISTPIVSDNCITSSGDCIWNLSLYPTGNDSRTAQFVYISIHTRSIPDDISSIFINYDIKIKELNATKWSENNVSINCKHLLHILQPQSSSSPLKSSQLKNCESITFEIQIKINRIIFKQSTRSEPPLAPNNNNNINKINHAFIATSTPKGVDTNVYDEYHEHKKDAIDEIKHDDTNNMSSYECFPAHIIPTFDHCISWTIRGKEYGRFVHAEVGKARETHWFCIENFRFRLCVFPNGHKQTSQGFVIIYLDIQRLPDKISNVRVHWSFACLQTGTRATAIKDLSNSRLGTMVWLPKALKLSQLYNITTNRELFGRRPRITFILQLNIFAIQYYSQPINSQFQHITQYKNNKTHQNNIFNKQFCNESCILIWKLNKMLIESIKECSVNQSFDSPQFDIWIIRILPKGVNNNNSFILSLKLLPYYLHNDIYGILVRIMFECQSLNILWNDVGSFNQRNNRTCTVRWDLGHILKYNEFAKQQQSSFEFKVQIIKLFGANNVQIEDVEKYQYLKKQYKQKMDDNNNLDQNIMDETKWNIMRIIKDLRTELKETKSELMALKQEQKEGDNNEEEEGDDNNELKHLIESNEVKLWFDKIINLPQHYNKFIDDGFEDFETIIEVKEQDLVEMDIDKKGHRIKIIKAINQIKLFMLQND